LISDRKISTGATSTDYGFKVADVGVGWYSMFAGNDVSMVNSVTRLAADMTRRIEDGQWAKPSAELVKQSMTQAYHHIRRGQIKDRLLSHFNWDIPDFLREAISSLPPQELAFLHNEIRNFDLGCEFLVCGFDEAVGEEPVFVHIQNPGTATLATVNSGYWSIGTGATSALAYLNWKQQSWRTPLALSIYNGIAAKVFAEKASDVGQTTNVIIVEHNSDEPKMLTDEQTNQIKSIWLREEVNIKPENLIERINNILGM
jgi:hypothetical protein